MDRGRPMQYSSSHDPEMYDEQSYSDDRHRGSPAQGYGYQNSRKDNQTTPPRGPAAERTYNAGYREQDNRFAEPRERRHHRSRSPRREGRGRYTDRDREGYRSPRDRSRSRSPYFGGPPNHVVILEGLPIDMTQEDVSNELLHNLRVDGIEEVRLIKDKRTGLSRQFAFAEFVGVREARSFLERVFPALSLPDPYNASPNSAAGLAKVRVSYSRDRDDRDKHGKGEDDWMCEVCNIANYPHRNLCFRCNAPRTRKPILLYARLTYTKKQEGATAHGVVVPQSDISAFSGFATTGDSDVSPDGAVSQFLILRGLEPGVNEELLAKGVSKLYKAKNATPPADAQATKKTKIVSTSNDASLGAREGSLRRVLLIRNRKTDESWRYGFAEFNSAEDAQAAMAKYKASEKFTISSKPVLVSYIHAGVFVPVLHPIGPESTRFTFSPLSNAAVRVMYWDEAGYASEYVMEAAPPASAVRAKEADLARLAAKAAANEGLVANGKDGEPKPKKRKTDKEALAGNKKVVAPHLQFWTNRHAELHGLPPKDDQDTSEDALAPASKPDATPDAPPSRSFADLVRKCCLLCSRQFKTEAEVHKHERMSQLHRENMKNETLVSKALEKLNKASETNPESSAYRDRARERRQAFNQPKQPAAQHNRAKEGGKGGPSKKAEEESAPVPSKGAALLGKMGWTAGEGLGAQGTGRTEAIKTELYSQGVGLGAEGGKLGDAAEEAHRQTKGGYAEFLSKTKDKAKERFESLG